MFQVKEGCVGGEGKLSFYSLVMNPKVSICARTETGKLVLETKEGLPAARTVNIRPLSVCAQYRLPLPVAVPMPFLLLFLKTSLGS